MSINVPLPSLDPSSTEFPFYFPESVYESIPHSGAAPSPSSETDDVKTATDFIFKGSISARMISRWSIPSLILLVSPMCMVHIWPMGAVFANHQAAAHVKNGEATSFSSSFEVSSTVSAKLKIPVYSDFEYTLEYVAQSDVRNGVFNTKFDTKKQAGHSTNIAAAAVNLFYVANVMHDISYQYGFTEQAGNFQKSNLERADRAMTLSLLMFLTLPILIIPNFSLPLMDNQE
ncbi:hypothetical protein BASA83_001779 [Batrachochytrium salamandrivorans]|nr:hypothetical protein BASA83_001779 [Batrachochytrium salamandrivorans]